MAKMFHSRKHKRAMAPQRVGAPSPARHPGQPMAANTPIGVNAANFYAKPANLGSADHRRGPSWVAPYSQSQNRPGRGT